MSAASDITAIADAYLEAVGGDAAAALHLAVSDLIDTTAEADLRARALDQWVSRGYVQGRAAERLQRIRQRQDESGEAGVKAAS
ncbi:hypothetical protein [Microvirga terricola]|uniref:Uncharacterized protein n=1 Tax=Microvirga terricola TaxID=2719797 RepID=A0ABX0VEK8_9HYPH|nr:hypothetical protein [Microvirga terricola]NIX77375.1 hypothetical protein [Microvirga terricola]